MRFVLDDGAGARECTAAVAADDVTVAELLAAAGVEDPGVVHVDGRRLPTDHLLDEAAIVDGATLALAARSGDAALPAWRTLTPPRLSVVAGVGAGRSVPLSGVVTVGRDPSSDLVVPSDTVSREHCRFTRDGAGTITVTDLGTTNGTWVEGHREDGRGVAAPVGSVVRVGAVVLRVEPPARDDRPSGLDPVRHRTAAGTVPFNRPPRPGGPPPPAPVALPAAPSTTGTPPPLQLAAIAVPILLGAVMVVLLDSWRYAAFMALGPLLLVATTLSGRRRARREGRTAERLQRAALHELQQDVLQAAAEERARRWELLPSVGEALRRATQPSTRLWERRPDHDDVLRLHLGIGAVPWTPATTAAAGSPSVDPDVAAVLDRWTLLPRSPVVVDLADGGVVGVVGERARAADVARSLLLQACVHHGPADLEVAVVADTDRVGDWSWTTWLPHVADAAGSRRLAAGPEDGRTLLAQLRARDDDTTLLLVLDAPDLLRGRDADARAVLRGVGGPVAGIVLAPTADQLPAVCDTVVELAGDDGAARCTQPAARVVIDEVLVAGLEPSACLPAARRLAGLDDPEVATARASLPDRVDLLDLLPDRLDVGAAWDRTSGDAGLVVPIGVGPDGPVVLDLHEDGPHGLLGGTTGAGKSELLRTTVAGLAATYDPDHCTFVLLDYKGGAAFDACADLPHVVGVVTDLDEHLGARALRCLEAELVHREGRLREAGVSDLQAWRRLPAAARGAPLPRLLVVIDELATLRAELPDFIEALVGIAQRGRSLGVHLLLGTQRPSGAVDENVRANANLRIALRMTDERDALDVVGAPDAAHIPPGLPGRGFLRTGPGDPVPVQTALVTGHARGEAARVRVTPLRFGSGEGPEIGPGPDAMAGPTDLERLVTACREACASRGIARPRTPWPAPLPPQLGLDELPGGPDGQVPFGLIDDPDRQRQVTAAWDPGRGNLLVAGTVGSGTTTTLATVALAAARTRDPDGLHLYVLDLGGGALAPLADLPHCGAVVTSREPERRTRLEAHLLAEADRRRGCTNEELARLPLLVLVVDALPAWLDDLDGPATHETYEAVQRLLVDGPRLRMVTVASVGRPGAVRSAVAAATEQWLLHRLADPTDLATVGLRPGAVPDLPPGRAVRPDGGLVQVARSVDLAQDVAAVTAATSPPQAAPAPVGELPPHLSWRGFRDEVEVTDGPWWLPVGLDAVTLEPVGVTLHAGDHAVVLGPPASGRSAVLAGLAALVAEHVDVHVLSAEERRWPAGVTVHPPAACRDLLQRLSATAVPALVLLDDAERIEDPGRVLDDLAAAKVRVHVVAAARQDVVAGDYGHWLRRLARTRTGLLLRPVGEDGGGDLLAARLPRRPPVASGPGRGWLVAAGTARFVQTISASS